MYLGLACSDGWSDDHWSHRVYFEILHRLDCGSSKKGKAQFWSNVSHHCTCPNPQKDRQYHHILLECRTRTYCCNVDISQSCRDSSGPEKRPDRRLSLQYFLLPPPVAQMKSCDSRRGLKVQRRLRTFLGDGRPIGTMFNFSRGRHAMRLWKYTVTGLGLLNFRKERHLRKRLSSLLYRSANEAKISFLLSGSVIGTSTAQVVKLSEFSEPHSKNTQVA